MSYIVVQIKTLARAVMCHTCWRHAGQMTDLVESVLIAALLWTFWLLGDDFEAVLVKPVQALKV